MKMENENVANVAIVKGFIHAIALPLFLTVALSNIFIGLAWIMFVSYFIQEYLKRSQQLIGSLVLQREWLLFS